MKTKIISLLTAVALLLSMVSAEVSLTNTTGKSPEDTDALLAIITEQNNNGANIPTDLNNSRFTWNSSSPQRLTSIDWNNCLLTGKLDLSGLPMLKEVILVRNQLTAIDVSKNPSLIELDLDGNQLTSLDVSHNDNLKYLYCRENQLTSLDVSLNPELELLYCETNQLTSLDLSNNPKLEMLYCAYNRLASLDLSNNPNIDLFDGDGQEITLYFTKMGENVYTAEINFPNAVTFGASDALTYNNNNGILTCDFPDIISAFTAPTGLADCVLSGILYGKPETLQNVAGKHPADVAILREIISEQNNNGAEIPTDLNDTSAYVWDGSASQRLIEIDWNDYLLTGELDLSGLPMLEAVYLSDNKLTEIDVSGLESLVMLNCSNNQLTALDVSGLESLVMLNCINNQLTEIDVSACSLLDTLSLWNNQLTAIDVSENPSLTYLDLDENQLTSLDVSLNPQLEVLYCAYNRLASLDLSNNPDITVFYGDGQEVTVYFSWSSAIDKYAAEINFPNAVTLGASDYMSYANGILTCDFPDMISDFTAPTNSANGHELTGTLTGNPDPLDNTVGKDPADVAILREIISEQNSNGAEIPIDLDNPAYVWDLSTPQRLTDIDWNACKLTGKLDLTGLSELIYIYFGKNQLTALDVSGLEELRSVFCATNQLTEIDVSACPALDSLYGAGNQLTAVDVSQNPSLINLNLDDNNLTSVDVSQNPLLIQLSLSNNKLTSLDVSGNPDLETLVCPVNRLTELDVSACTELQTLDCRANRLTALDFTGLDKLTLTDLSDQYIQLMLEDKGDVYTVSVNFGEEVAFYGNLSTAFSYDFAKKILTINKPDNYVSVLTAEFTAPTTGGTDMLSGNFSGLTADLNNTDDKDENDVYILLNNMNYQLGNGAEFPADLDDTDFYLWSNTTPKRLTELHLDNIKMAGHLDLDGLDALEKISCNKNYLDEINFGDNPALTEADCSDNRLSRVAITGLPNLKSFKGGGQKLTANFEPDEEEENVYRDNTFIFGTGTVTFDSPNADISYDPDTFEMTAKTSEATVTYGFTVNLTEISGNIGAFTLDGSIEAQLKPAEKDSDDVAALQAIIAEQNGLGADIPEDLDDPFTYTWNIKTGRLENLIWNGYNLAVSLDLSAFTGLTDVLLRDNGFLVALDVSGCTELKSLLVNRNALEIIDLSKNTKLKELDISENRLTSIDIRHLKELTAFSGEGQENDILLEKKADGVYSCQIGFGYGAVTFDHPDVSYDEVEFVLTSTSPYVESVEYEITLDRAVGDVFALSGKLNVTVEGSAEKDAGDLAALKAIIAEQDAGALIPEDYDDRDRYKWDYDTGRLTYLNWAYCELNDLDLSALTALKTVFLNQNVLTDIDVSGCKALQEFVVADNMLTELDVSHNPALTMLFCDINNITELDLSHNPKLLTLSCFDNEITELDLSGNPLLEVIDCGINQLTELDVSQLSKLDALYCHSNILTALDVSNNPALKTLFCDDNRLTALDVSHNPALTILDCTGNRLTELNVQNTALSALYCSDNRLSYLDLRGMNVLEIFEGFGQSVYVKFEKKDGVYTAQVTFGAEGVMFELPPPYSITYNNGTLTTDADFTVCGFKADTGGYIDEFAFILEGAIQRNAYKDDGDLDALYEITSVQEANYVHLPPADDECYEWDYDTGRLIGINWDGSNNQQMGKIEDYLNLSVFTALKSLTCNDNLITGLNISGCVELETLDCRNNALSHVNLTGLNNLTDFKGGGQERKVNFAERNGVFTNYGYFGESPTFGSPALSYSVIGEEDGMITSADKTVKSSTFSAPSGTAGYTVSGTLIISYDTLIWGDSLTPALVDGDRLEIVSGAWGSLPIRDGDTVTIYSNGKVTNHDGYEISITIGAGAKVIWEADYSGNAELLVLIEGEGEFVIAQGGSIANADAEQDSHTLVIEGSVVVTNNGVITGGKIVNYGTINCSTGNIESEITGNKAVFTGTVTFPESVTVLTGQKLRDAAITGGIKPFGKFAWENPETVFDETGEYTERIQFIWENSGNYALITTEVTITVISAEGHIRVTSDTLDPDSFSVESDLHVGSQLADENGNVITVTELSDITVKVDLLAVYNPNEQTFEQFIKDMVDFIKQSKGQQVSQ